jgi:formiminoglutamase
LFNPDLSIWQGRQDLAEGPQALRWHQRMAAYAAGSPPGVALLGFACDEGVRRNQGRTGAAQGPPMIRRALANLAWHQTHPVYDAGDLACLDGMLEANQARLANAVSTLLLAGHRPLVIGGGHETAWGTFQGLARALPGAPIGIVNCDAHFDLREAAAPHSGTPFAQIADWCAANNQPFRYLCLGIAEATNSIALFLRARSLGARWCCDVELNPWDLAKPLEVLQTFLGASEAIYLSVDLDVLPAATMPAVSAPALRGVSLETLEVLMDRVIQSGKLAAADLVEYNPSLDPDGRGARLAAGLVYQLARHWRPRGTQ